MNTIPALTSILHNQFTVKGFYIKCANHFAKVSKKGIDALNVETVLAKGCLDALNVHTAALAKGRHHS